FGKQELEKAEKSLAAHTALKPEIEKNKNLDAMYQTEEQELRGRLALARGKSLEGLKFLSDAAEREFEIQRGYADPPAYPEALYNSLGEAYLELKSPLLAVQAFEKALTLTHCDLFALSGLVRAYATLGEKAKAEEAMAALLYVTADADQGVPAI